MRILITGSNGLLGQKIVAQLIDKSIDFLATSAGDNRNPELPSQAYHKLDVTQESAVSEIIKNYKPTAVINTAAMTNVDLCEKEKEACFLLNTQAVEYLANACELVNAQLVHLSTDFIFDGEDGPYKETDEPNPLSEYGKSKLDAEHILEHHQVKSTILRTMVVYGKGHNLSRNNIILWLYGELQKGASVKLVSDQHRAPTYANDLAWACIEAVSHKVEGVFNISGPETLPISEIGFRMAKHFNFDEKLINVIRSESLAAPAVRPPKTGFILTKAADILAYKPLTLEQTFDLLFP